MKLIEADVKKLIKDLGNSFDGSNESQMKGVQLLKGLATSDDPLANEFMKKLDKATTDISKSMTKNESTEQKEEKIKEQRYAVYSKGGSIGDTKTGKPLKVFDTAEEAKEYAKRMRKLLSPGEKKYYGLGYFVAPFKEKVKWQHEFDSDTIDYTDIEAVVKTFDRINIGWGTVEEATIDIIEELDFSDDRLILGELEARYGISERDGKMMINRIRLYISKLPKKPKTILKKKESVDFRKVRDITKSDGVETYVIHQTLGMIADGQTPQTAFEVACENENLYGSRPDIVSIRKLASNILDKNFGYSVNPFYESKEKSEIIEILEEVQIGETILEPGDKIKIIESIRNLAQRVKQALDNKGFNYKAITYNDKVGEVTVVLGFDYPEERWEEMQDMLEQSGFKQEIDSSIILFVPADSGAQGEQFL